MARFVNISLLGPKAIEASYSYGLESLVENMKRHWLHCLAKVLPDKPDLIIVPEACDRYPNLTMEQRKEYYNYRGNKIRDFFSDVAKENHCYIAYSACRCTPDDKKY
ncbi:MAG: hypothetical protein GX633_04970, partial [Clostridiales bacterium]|nr:hypothetical protein [Clostridiales bacterium]